MINYYWHSEKGYFLWGTQWKGYLFLIFWAHCLGYVSQYFVQASEPSWPGSALPREQSDQCLHWAIHKKYFLYPYLSTYHHTTQNILWHFWKIKLSLSCIKNQKFSHYPAVKGDFFPTCPTKIFRVSKCLSATIFFLLCEQNIWATSWENLSYAICKQQRRRSACASAQSDQHHCCSLHR